MYFQGHGVPQDYAAVVSWYRKAADQGNVDAQIKLAGAYYKGLGVAQDDAQRRAGFERQPTRVTARLDTFSGDIQTLCW